jgi:DNA processing protein
VTCTPDTAALIALLKRRAKPWSRLGPAIAQVGGPEPALDQELGLLASQALEDANHEAAAWEDRGIHVISLYDDRYPLALRTLDDRPPLLFVAGELEPADERSVAVVGSRQASGAGLRIARAIAERLIAAGFTVASGLAAGIDTAAHTAALRAGGRTIAVIGTGLDRCFPPQNAQLQRQIAERCAVISQFWPHEPPSRTSFPRRNAVMSGLSLASVIVEASQTSGARIQARLALAQGRQLVLFEPLLEQQWARELAERPGAHVAGSPSEVIAVVERIAPVEAPTTPQAA